jgi:hypothetical protein
MSTPKNLWGDLPLASAIRTPVVILREQASELTKLTNGILEGEITTTKVGGDKPFFCQFNIIAPALDRYVYSIAWMTHDIKLYPIHLVDEVNSVSYDPANEEEFMADIAKILSSTEVHRVVAALLTQSRSEEGV